MSFKEDKQIPRFFHYCIKHGNNHEDVTRAMQTRPHWRAGSDQEVINFLWQTTIKGMDFKLGLRDVKQVLNHFEYHRFISTKYGLFESLALHAETAKFELFGAIPLTFSFDSAALSFASDMADFEKYFRFLQIMNENGRRDNVQSIHRTVMELQKTVREDHIKHIGRTSRPSKATPPPPRHSKPTPKKLEAEPEKAKIAAEESKAQIVSEPKPTQSDELTPPAPDDASAAAVDRQPVPMEQPEQKPPKDGAEDKASPALKPAEEAEKTLKADRDLPEDQDSESKRIYSLLRGAGILGETFKEAARQRRFSGKSTVDYSKVKLHSCQNSGQNLWIFKASGFNRGFGIEIFSDLDTLKKLVKNLAAGYEERIIQNNEVIVREKNRIRATKFVIQKYIERPLLFRERKFDLRVWVMISHAMKGYVFDECYVRVSSEPFVINSNEKFIHLTNNAIQKYAAHYEEDETLVDAGLLETETRRTHPEFDFRAQVWPRVVELSRLSIECCYKKINQFNRKTSFEIFGYDFMVDADFNTWLIEVNTNPSITTPGNLLKKLVPRMLNDAFKLTLDVLFPPRAQPAPEPTMKDPPEPQQVETFPVDGHPDDENLWKLVFDPL